MADNNSYEINVTLDDFNGIITKNPNGDGTYNITYTNLTAQQIKDIGEAFEAAMENNLKPVAINNGDYDDLTKKPIIPNGYTEESTFNKIAFSGNYNDLTQATRPELTNWPNTKPAFHEVAFNGDYTKLSNTPNLNVSDNNSSITGLANVAISGNYNDLQNAPISLSSKINLSLYSTNNNSANNKLWHLEYYNNDYQCYITDYSNFKDENNKTLKSAIDELFEDFYKLKQCFIENQDGLYFITNMKKTTDKVNNPPDFDFERIDLLPISNTNFTQLLSNLADPNNNEINSLEDLLGALNFGFTHCHIIIDLKNDILFFKSMVSQNIT